jgi:hypothetical protein
MILAKARPPTEFHTLDFYRQHEGYDALKRWPEPDSLIDLVKASPSRPRRRGISDRHEVAVRRQKIEPRYTPATPTKANRARSKITC